MSCNIIANKLAFWPDLHLRDIGFIYNQIQDLVEWQGYDDIIVDLSQVRKSFADSALPFVAMLHKYATDSVRFRVVMPVSDDLERLFRNANWAHFISPKDFEFRADSKFGHIPAHRFTDPSTQHELHQALMKRVLELFPGLSRENLTALDWALYEITDNVLTHSESSIGGLVQLTIRRKSQEIQFIVSDIGIGVPSSLRESLLHINSDELALQESIKEGITRGTGQGNGLYGTFRLAVESGGAFSINSGKAYLALSRNGDMHSGINDYIFPGTSIECTIGFSDHNLLEGFT